MPGHIDELITYLSDESQQDKTSLHILLTNVLQDLRGLVGDDSFSSEAERAVTALREHDQDGYASAVETYAQNPSDDAFIKATKDVITLGAAKVTAPELSDVADVPSADDMDEELTAVVEKMQAITPEFIEQKFDEALADPQTQATLEQRGISVDQIMSQKGQLVERLNTNIQGLLADLPRLQEEGMETARELIAKAVDDFPTMFDEAFDSELSKAMERASQRLQDKFDQAGRETEEARRFLGNGEISTDSSSELAQKYGAAVTSMADNLMQMRTNDQKAFEGMAEHISKQGEYGQQVMELVNKRIAEEAAMNNGQQGVDTPKSAAGLGNN